jgi:DNA-binding SARP family transcriptional activator/pimeloyl-ACP methyl ester carboxylesterase
MSHSPRVVAVRMFGSLELDVAGRRLGVRDFGGLKPKRLLELLLIERGRPVSKDRLADQLWGEHLPRRVAATIETYVSVLRRHLPPRLIVTEHGGYRLPTELVSLDTDRFDALLRRAAGAGDLVARRAALETAVALGEPELLSDEPYARWVQAPREHYRRRQAQALVDLAECGLALGDYRAGLEAADRVLTREPTSERAWRAVMLAHYALGDRDAALQAHARCRAALSEALGVDPTTQTAELHVAMLRNEDPVRLLGHGSERGPLPAARQPAARPIGYADNAGVRIAYQVVGDGPIDLVFSPSHVTNLAATWDDPTYAAFLRRLAAMARLILFDKRGTGLSDPALDFPTPHQRSEDLVRVLDAVGVQRAVLFGVCGGGALCAHLAAEHPERAGGLILHNSAARMLWADDYPWGMAAGPYERYLAAFEEVWLDERDQIARRNPWLADNPRYRDWYARYVRLAASPYMARRLAEMNADLDIRLLLADIRTPTLVITRTGDAWLSPDNSRYLAEHIPGAHLLELPGVDHDPWVGDTEQVLTAVGGFLAERRAEHSAPAGQARLVAQNR